MYSGATNPNRVYNQGKEKTMTDNPIKAAKAVTPCWIMEINRYDGLEIHPVRDTFRNREFPAMDPIDRGTRCEPCEPDQAEFWSVYAHCKEGGIECLEDFHSIAEARSYAEQLLAAWPHLGTFGLLDFCG